jgi:hypothetical protein
MQLLRFSPLLILHVGSARVPELRLARGGTIMTDLGRDVVLLIKSDGQFVELHSLAGARGDVIIMDDPWIDAPRLKEEAERMAEFKKPRLVPEQLSAPRNRKERRAASARERRS